MTRKYPYIFYYEKLRFSLIKLFCCAKFSIIDAICNPLTFFMMGIKGTVARMNQTRGEIFNSGKYPHSIGVYIKMCYIYFFLTKQSTYLLLLNSWSGLLSIRLITLSVINIR